MVGRKRERALAQKLLDRPDIRLLTLTGPGGIGKTRLALQIASDSAGAYTDGVRFVPLEAVGDASLVATAIAHAIDVAPAVGIPLNEAMTSALQAMEILLVLDNFEHVIGAAPVVATLLAGCPRLKVLVTSRVLLRVTGEHIMAIPPLPVPDPQAALSPRELARFPAIELFVERVRAVDLTFSLSTSASPHVAEICRRVDGLPLAIELVAPRLRHLAVTDLLKRLDPRLPLLTGGPSDQPSRLQTMRNAIAWGYDLLAPGDQALLRCLAVFTGGFSLEAAEGVTDEGGRHAGRRPLVESLGMLIDASFVQTARPLHENSRYRILETIREFLLERLEAHGETEPVRQAHARYFLELAERRAHSEFMEDGSQGSGPLALDHANLRAALGWLDETGDTEPLTRLAAALGRYWSAFGHYQEGHAWLERALARHEEPPQSRARARALVALGMIEIYQGMYREAEATLTEGLAGCRRHHDVFSVSRALVGLGGLANLRGDFGPGAAMLEECLALSQTIPDPRVAGISGGWALINLAMAARALGDLDLARERLETALARLREAGDRAGVITALCDLGDLARDRHDYAQALAVYREALDLGQPGTPVITVAIESVGIVAAAVGQVDRATRLLGVSEALRERFGLGFRVAENQAALQQAVDSVRIALGADAFATAWAAARKLGPAQAIQEARATIPVATAAIGTASRRAILTRRESEILQFLVEGTSDAAIAEALFISVRTVENHVAHILAKFGVRSRAAVRAAGQVPDSPA